MDYFFFCLLPTSSQLSKLFTAELGHNDEYLEPLIKINLTKLQQLLLPKMYEYLYYFHLFLSFALFTNCFLIRIILVINEYNYLSHTKLPVSKDWLIVFKHAFHFNILTWVLIVVSIITLAFLCHSASYKHFYNNISFPLLLGYVFVLLIVHFSQVQDSKFNNLLHIRNSNLLDYGSGLAYSYYHGYLEIIGPTYGDQRKGITERLQNYEDIEGVKIPIKLLFILVPLSSFIPTQLSEGTDSRLNASKNLEKLVIDRAGVKNRSYENMIYRISGPKRWYVCAEGATPILTLSEALQLEPNLEYLKEEILFKFYQTLTFLINKYEKTRGKFDVILYNDKENMGDVLEQRISEMLKPV